MFAIVTTNLLRRPARTLFTASGIAVGVATIVALLSFTQGLRNKAIAERLSISEGTVKIHLHNIYEKLGVDGRLELVLCAQQKGLI